MYSHKNGFKYLRSVLALMFCLTASVIMMPFTAYAEEETEKTVRVGWYDSSFNRMDEYGRRSGYAYEYQQKIAAYTGWKYEYVEGSWSELLQMLIDGDIDLMSDVSYTEERTELMLFASLPMGAEEYYLFVSPDNKDYTTGSYSYFNNKKIGVNKGSIQIGFYKDWAEANGISSEIVELTCSEEESLLKLKEGELDGYVTLDNNGDVENCIPVVKIGSSDYFFAVNKNRPDLQEELNAAMSSIQDENRYFNQQMVDKYINTFGANIFLKENEKSWLTDHRSIRVGYQDNFLSFSDRDDNTGELTGALKDYLDQASGCFANATLDFEPVAYATAEAAYEALNNGEVDCLFPAYISSSDCEDLDMVVTPEVMAAEVYVIVRDNGQEEFVHKEERTLAAIQNDPNHVAVIRDHFPGSQIKEYKDMQACLLAVANREVDGVVISNYQYNYLDRQCDKLMLAPIATGEREDSCFALKRGNTELYSILTRTTGIVDSTVINAALTHYSAESAKTTWIDLIKDNPFAGVFIITVLVVLIIIIIEQQRLLRARREVKEKQNQVDSLNKLAFADELTSVQNWYSFTNSMQKIQKQLDNKEQPEFAVGVFDCNDLKQINDRYGTDKGDAYIKAASRLICSTFKHSPVFRIGGDKFAVILQKDDFESRKDLMVQLEASQKEIGETGKYEWEAPSVATGMADYDPSIDPIADNTYRRAERLMYKEKHKRKI